MSAPSDVRTDRGRGRLLGALIALQMAGLIVPFELLLPIAAPSAEWLETAARSAPRVTAGLLLLVVNGAVTIAISILAWPLFRHANEELALWLLLLSSLWFGTQAVDDILVLSMLSMSESITSAGAVSDGARAAAVALGGSRRWAHVTALLMIDAWILCFYVNLIRAKVLPRAARFSAC